MGEVSHEPSFKTNNVQQSVKEHGPVLDRVIVFSVFIPLDYIANIFACPDMLNNLVYGLFLCGIALFGFFRFSRT